MAKKETKVMEPGDPLVLNPPKRLDYGALAVPFEPSEIEWRVGQAAKDKMTCTMLAYLTARAVMDRLDEVVGPENWTDSYSQGPEGGVLCGLGIKANGEWVWKYDGAENTQIEAVKGGYSGAFKRAAVKWGIGRYLYGLGVEWHDTVEHFTAKVPGVDYVRINIKGSWVSVARPKLPRWALPPAPKDENWSDDSKAFCAELSSNGMSYDDVASWCESLGQDRPSQITSERRSRLLDYLNSEEGLRSFSSWRD